MFSSGLAGVLGSGVARAPSEPGLGTYCSWLVEAFGSVLAGLSPVTYWSASRFVGELEPSPASLAGGRCRCGRVAHSVAPGALPTGCPGRLAAGCPLAIATLAGHGYLSVALVACILGIVGLPPDLSAFLLPFLALSAFLLV